MSKFTSTCSPEDNPIDLGSWGSHFSLLFSEDPPPLVATIRFMLLGHFAKLDHSKNYIIITPASIQAHIYRLEPGKASGSDGMQLKYLMYGKVKWFEHLASLF